MTTSGDEDDGPLYIDESGSSRIQHGPLTPPYSLDPLMHCPPYPYNPAALTDHKTDLHRTRVCKQCNYSTSDPQLFLDHQSREHGVGDSRSCHSCSFVTQSPTEMAAHARTHRRFSYNPEPMSSPPDDANNNEKDEPLVITPLTPESCEKSVEDHHDTSPILPSRDTFECPSCSFVCGDPRLLVEHQEQHHRFIPKSHEDWKSEPKLNDDESHHRDNSASMQHSVFPRSYDDKKSEEMFMNHRASEYAYQNGLGALANLSRDSLLGKKSSKMSTPESGTSLSAWATKDLPAVGAASGKSKSSCTPVREAVDPAKYVTIREPDGVKYACSKCGNIYKWRKSLNKHWKEKHEGEIPDPRSSFTPLSVPRMKSTDRVYHKHQKYGNNILGAYSAMMQLPRSTDSRNKGETYKSPVLSQALKVPPLLEGFPHINPELTSKSYFAGLGHIENSDNGYDYKPKTFKEQPSHIPAYDKPSPPVSPETDTSILDLSRKTQEDTKVDASFEMAPPQDEPLDFSMKSSKSPTESKPVKTECSSPQTVFPQEYPVSSPNLQCPSCAYIGRNKNDYDNHMDLHLRKRHYKCANCQQVFFTIRELNDHFLETHMEALDSKSGLNAMKEPYGQSESTQLYKYLTMDSSKNLLTCIVCGAVFQWEWTLAKHFDQDHPPLPNPYRKRSSSGLPENAHKKSRTHEDGQFDSEFPEVADGESKRQYFCKLCDFECRRKDLLLAHYNEYHSAKSLNLEKLMSVEGADENNMPLMNYPGMTDLTTSNTAIVIPKAPEESDKTHEVVNTKPAMPRMSPKVNNAAMNNTQDLPSKNAETLLPFKCSVCEYRARWPSEITQHMKNHSDEKPYLCPRCTYRSKWKWDVVKHLKRCGGGTVKDVIDTTKMKKNQDSKSAAESQRSSSSRQSTVTKTVSREQLSNGPPNVTVVQACDSESSDRVSPDAGATSDGQSAYNGNMSSQQHYCPQCPFVGNSPAELKRHSRVHSDEKPFICKTCGYSSKWKCDLKKHLRTYNHTSAVPLTYGGHGRKPSEWPEMDKYLDKSDTSPGKSSDEDPEPLEASLFCTKCSFVASNESVLLEHYKMHQSRSMQLSTKLKCKICNFEAVDLSGFLQHKLSHSQSEENGDNQSSPTGNSNEVPRHRRKASQQFRIVQNQVCQDSSEDDSGIEENSKRQSSSINTWSSGQFTCEWCNWTTDNLDLLYSHSQEVHQQELEKRQNGSDHNKLSFAQTLELQPTNQEIAPPKPKAEPRPILQMSSKRRRRLKTCQKCGYITDNMTTLQRHMSKHGGNGKFTCLYCDYSVDRHHVLQYHTKLVHNSSDDITGSSDSDGGPQKKRPRTDKASPEEFEMQHNGKKTSYTCTKCPYQASNSNNALKHMRHHGSGGKFCCQVCDFSLDNYDHIVSHMTSVHGVQYQNSNNAQITNLTNAQSNNSAVTLSKRVPSKSQKSVKISKIAKYRCAKCSHINTSWNRFVAHQLIHKAKKECSLCSHKSTTKALLRQHMLSH